MWLVETEAPLGAVWVRCVAGRDGRTAGMPSRWPVAQGPAEPRSGAAPADTSLSRCQTHARTLARVTGINTWAVAL